MLLEWAPLYLLCGSRQQFPLCPFQASKIEAKLQFYDYVSAKKKAKLVTAQQTLYFTQTREKPRENDAGRALEIEDKGEGREK